MKDGKFTLQFAEHYQSVILCSKCWISLIFQPCTIRTISAIKQNKRRFSGKEKLDHVGPEMLGCPAEVGNPRSIVCGGGAPRLLQTQHRQGINTAQPD